MGRFQLKLIYLYFPPSFHQTVLVSDLLTCNKFYIGKTNRNFNTRFKEHRKDFRHAEGKSKFSEHVLKEGHKKKTIEETMSIIHLENNHTKINTLEEIEILKAASSKYLLNDVIAGKK